MEIKMERISKTLRQVLEDENTSKLFISN